MTVGFCWELASVFLSNVSGDPSVIHDTWRDTFGKHNIVNDLETWLILHSVFVKAAQRQPVQTQGWEFFTGASNYLPSSDAWVPATFTCSLAPPSITFPLQSFLWPAGIITFPGIFASPVSLSLFTTPLQSFPSSLFYDWLSLWNHLQSPIMKNSL